MTLPTEKNGAPPPAGPGAAPRITQAVLAHLVEHLFGASRRQASLHVYALLDGARDKRIYPLVFDSGHEHGGLVRGNMPMDLEPVLPTLVKLWPTAPLTRTLLLEGWGDSWGIFVAAPASLEKLQAHLRQLLMVRTEDGKTLFFRFYDPRVLRSYLPTCNASELDTIFGPIRTLFVEAAGGEGLLAFSREGGRLQQELRELKLES
jgi:hypothetical protein